MDKLELLLAALSKPVTRTVKSSGSINPLLYGLAPERQEKTSNFLTQMGKTEKDNFPFSIIVRDMSDTLFGDLTKFPLEGIDQATNTFGTYNKGMDAISRLIKELNMKSFSKKNKSNVE